MDQKARARILISAKKEFSEKGFDGARMSAIARVAKVNQAMIHYYFKSKEHLYETMLQKLFPMKQITAIVDALNKYDLDPSQHIYMGIYMLVHLNANPMDPEFERILHSLIGSGGIKKVISIVRKVLLPIFQTLENNIKLGVEKGEFETQDALLAALEIFIFCTHYRSFYKFFENSNWYEHLYGEGSANIAFDFFIKHTLKALCPEGKKLILPVIPENMLYEFDKKIDSIIHELQGVQKENNDLPQSVGN